jgi:hypothetical protein
MAKFWQMVNRVIDNADVLLLLLDARLVDETRNEEVEMKVRNVNKPLIYVVTKSDLVDKETAEKYKKTLKPCVFVSAKEHYGTTMLRERILIEAKKVYGDKETIIVGVLGYPNVGKSSLINAMKGKSSAPVSSVSGYTRSVQMIRGDNRIMFFDTPGVIPYHEKDDIKHAFIGTIDYNKEKDPDVVVIALMKRFPGKVESYYGVKVKEDKEETLEEITVKRKLLKKKAEPDIERMAREILKCWQEGKIK